MVGIQHRPIEGAKVFGLKSPLHGPKTNMVAGNPHSGGMDEPAMQPCKMSSTGLAVPLEAILMFYHYALSHSFWVCDVWQWILWYCSLSHTSFTLKGVPGPRWYYGSPTMKNQVLCVQPNSNACQGPAGRKTNPNLGYVSGFVEMNLLPSDCLVFLREGTLSLAAHWPLQLKGVVILSRSAISATMLIHS